MPTPPLRRTSREREVLRLAAEGYSTREIAQKLFVSPKAAQTQRLAVGVAQHADEHRPEVRFLLTVEQELSSHRPHGTPSVEAEERIGDTCIQRTDMVRPPDRNGGTPSGDTESTTRRA